MKNATGNPENGRKRLIGGLVVGSLAVVTVAAAAGHQRGGRDGSRHGSGDWSIERIDSEMAKHAWVLERYGIDAAKQREILDGLRTLEPELDRLRAQREQLEVEIQTLLSSDMILAEEAIALRAEVVELAGQTVSLGFDTMIALADDLTVEQRRELVKHWEGR